MSRLRRTSEMMVWFELDPGRASAGRMESPCIANDDTTGATNALPLINLVSVSRLPVSRPSSASRTFGSCSAMVLDPHSCYELNRDTWDINDINLQGFSPRS